MVGDVICACHFGETAHHYGQPPAHTPTAISLALRPTRSFAQARAMPAYARRSSLHSAYDHCPCSPPSRDCKAPLSTPRRLHGTARYHTGSLVRKGSPTRRVRPLQDPPTSPCVSCAPVRARLARSERPSQSQGWLAGSRSGHREDEMNKVTLIGRVGGEPRVRTTARAAGRIISLGDQRPLGRRAAHRVAYGGVLERAGRGPARSTSPPGGSSVSRVACRRAATPTPLPASAA